MNMRFRFLLTFLCLLLPASISYAQSNQYLSIDPRSLVSVKEARNIAEHLGDELFPGWDFTQTPILLYRPNVQDVLINFPHKPEGFEIFNGPHLLSSEMIYVRNDSTLFPIDGQNTTTEIDGINTLVVADPYSRMRNQIRGVAMNAPKDFIDGWLEEWAFIPGPYDELDIILHEGFHVYQHQHSDKFANEGVVATYPLLDPVNNALHQVEGLILLDAVRAESNPERTRLLNMFVAVRQHRHGRLDAEFVEYEKLNEYAEGMAAYIPLKFLLKGTAIRPVSEMMYLNGFSGYEDTLTTLFEERLDAASKKISGDIQGGMDPFGAGPLRLKLYDFGALQGLLLDVVHPTWKNTIFDEGVYQSDLLAEAAALSEPEQEKDLSAAKEAYGYERIYQEKVAFEEEGRLQIDEKLAAILETDQTLVTISFDALTDEIQGIGYTPFGVTQVSKTAAIYDMVPIAVGFTNEASLRMNIVSPVLIDDGKNEVVFAITSPPETFSKGKTDTVQIQEFTLTKSPMTINIVGNKVDIRLGSSPGQ